LTVVNVPCSLKRKEMIAENLANVGVADKATEAFRESFGGAPEVVAVAPGRVNLIGEHTDYNDGFVLPMALDRGIALAGRRRGDDTVLLHSANFGQTVPFRLGELRPDETARWADYPKGVLDEFQKAGHRVAGMACAIYGDVPLGAGLSSSAAFEVVTAYVVSQLNGIALSGPEMARLCQRAENRFVGVNCGIMDQMASALSLRDHALFIDCRDLNYRHVPLDRDRVSLVICNSGVQRGLVDSEYNTRRAQCEEGVRLLSEILPGIRALRDVSVAAFEVRGDVLPDEVSRRCRHVITENRRVERAVDCLQTGDYAAFGALMNASHVSLRDDYEVSCTELDALVTLARDIEGCLGARLTGAGFGGCTVNLLERDRMDAFVQKLPEHYERLTGIRGEIYVCVPEEGVRKIG